MGMTKNSIGYEREHYDRLDTTDQEYLDFRYWQERERIKRGRVPCDDTDAKQEAIDSLLRTLQPKR